MMSKHSCMGGYFFNSILDEWGVGLIFSSIKANNHSFKTSIEWFGVRNFLRVGVKNRHQNS
jgi:hypothetical protein